MNNRVVVEITAVLALSLFVGCGGTESLPPSSTKIDVSAFILKEEPPGARDVIAAREAAGDGDEVVVFGRIGGSEVPWVEGVAAFMIADASLKSCDEIGSDNCPKPWDFC